jgi:HD-GYP domain-containing protein (c-di-GMP phosphodiesterase class II)
MASKGNLRGLRGEQIPLVARVFIMADVWDALRADWPYRPAWSADRVREPIPSLTGTHFDLRIVRAALESDLCLSQEWD